VFITYRKNKLTIKWLSLTTKTVNSLLTKKKSLVGLAPNCDFIPSLCSFPFVDQKALFDCLFLLQTNKGSHILAVTISIFLGNRWFKNTELNLHTTAINAVYQSFEASRERTRHQQSLTAINLACL
jgi:hypothetical protein